MCAGGGDLTTSLDRNSERGEESGMQEQGEKCGFTLKVSKLIWKLNKKKK